MKRALGSSLAAEPGLLLLVPEARADTFEVGCFCSPHLSDGFLMFLM
jgi:hypothetical protein